MKGKQLAILLAVTVVLGAVGIYLFVSNGKSWKESGGSGPGSKVINLAADKVEQVTIKSHTDETTLVKKGDDWVVKERADYPASMGQLINLLRTVWDLKAVQELEVGPSQMGRLELEPPSKETGAGTLLEFKDGSGKPLGGLLLGKQYVKSGGGAEEMGMGGFPAGRYVLPEGGKNVALVSESLEEANAKPESWLDHEFFKLESVTSVALAGPTEAQKWKITRANTTDPWKLEGAKPEEKLDENKANLIVNTLAFPSFTDVLAPDAKPAETGLDQPAVLTIETADHFTYTLKVGKPQKENYPVTVDVTANLAKERTPGKDEKPEDKKKLDDEFAATKKRLEEKLATEKKFAGRPYLIAKATMDQVIKDRPALLEDKKSAAPAATSSAVPAPLFPGVKPHPTTATTPPISVTTPPVSVPPANPAPNPPKPGPGEKPANPATPPPAAAPNPGPASKPGEEKAPAPGPKPAPAEPKPASEKNKAGEEARPAAPEKKKP